MNRIRKSCFLKAINLSVFFAFSKFLIFACLITYVTNGGILYPRKVFITIALFNSIRVAMTLLFPMAIESTANTYIACKRIQKFLMLDEIKPISNLELSGFDGVNGGIEEKEEIIPEKPQIIVENIIAKWGSVREKRDVNQSHNNIHLLF